MHRQTLRAVTIGTAAFGLLLSLIVAGCGNVGHGGDAVGTSGATADEVGLVADRVVTAFKAASGHELHRSSVSNEIQDFAGLPRIE
jgi:hypothetical protein